MRGAIGIKLQFQGIPVVLLPEKGDPIRKPSGGHDYGPPVPRQQQVFVVSRTTGFDGIEFSPNDDGKSRKRAYVMTGAYDAEVAIGDTFEDDEAEYTVDTVDNSSGYKTIAGVTGFLKEP